MYSPYSIKTLHDDILYIFYNGAFDVADWRVIKRQISRILVSRWLLWPYTEIDIKVIIAKAKKRCGIYYEQMWKTDR